MVKLLTCLFLEVPDSFLRLAVLEVSIHSTVTCLDFLLDLLLGVVVCKAASVYMIMLDYHTVRPGVSLKHLI